MDLALCTRDVLVYIFGFFDVSELVLSSTVCKLWRDCINQPIVWKNAYIQQYKAPITQSTFVNWRKKVIQAYKITCDPKIVAIDITEWDEYTPGIGGQSACYHNSPKSFFKNGSIFEFGGMRDEGYSNDMSVIVLDEEGDADGICKIQEWEYMELGQSPQYPRAGLRHCLFEHEDTLFIFGGATVDAFDDPNMYTYHIPTHTWTTLQFEHDESPCARILTALITEDGRIITFGGRDHKKKIHNDVWVFDISEKRWTKLETKGTAPTPRYSCVMQVYKEKLFVFGGWYNTNSGGDDWSNTRFLNELYVLDLSSLVWKKVVHPNESPIPAARCQSNSFLFENYMVIYGGAQHETPGIVDVHHDVWFLDLDTCAFLKAKFDEKDKHLLCACVKCNDVHVLFLGGLEWEEPGEATRTTQVKSWDLTRLKRLM